MEGDWGRVKGTSVFVRQWGAVCISFFHKFLLLIGNCDGSYIYSVEVCCYRYYY